MNELVLLIKRQTCGSYKFE